MGGLDISTKCWTDKEGNEAHIGDLRDMHILYIQRMLKRILRDPGSIRKRMELLACDYDSEYQDKDWYVPGSAINEIDTLIEREIGETKTSLMIISEEVNRRGLTPLEMSKVNEVNNVRA